MALRFLAPAARDLTQHTEYLAEKDYRAGLRLGRAIARTLALLEGMPELGSVYDLSDDTLPEVRAFTVPRYRNYVIFYRPIADGIEVVRILHGAQNIDPSLFE